MPKVYRGFILPALMVAGLLIAIPASAVARGHDGARHARGHHLAHLAVSHVAHHSRSGRRVAHGPDGFSRRHHVRAGHVGFGDRRHAGFVHSRVRHHGFGYGKRHVRYGRRRRGLATLPQLPVLIDRNHPYIYTPVRHDRALARGRPPGVADPVPQVRAGSGRTAAGSYRRIDENGFGFPDHVAGGTYAGSIDAAVDPGNGLYFNVYGGAAGPARATRRGSAVKVIDVKPGVHNADCEIEHGVCVIRP